MDPKVKDFICQHGVRMSQYYWGKYNIDYDDWKYAFDDAIVSYAEEEVNSILTYSLELTPSVATDYVHLPDGDYVFVVGVYEEHSFIVFVRGDIAHIVSMYPHGDEDDDKLEVRALSMPVALLISRCQAALKIDAEGDVAFQYLSGHSPSVTEFQLLCVPPEPTFSIYSHNDIKITLESIKRNIETFEYPAFTGGYTKKMHGETRKFLLGEVERYKSMAI